MCGIAGIYYSEPNRPVDKEVLKRMTEVLAHRGPDGSGCHLESQIGLGHRRLAILDLTEVGGQPMHNEDGTIWIVYNGECYRYRDHIPFLRSKGHTIRSRSDTEVLLHLYEEFDLDFVSKLDGMFAFALWDQRKRRLILGRDRLGIKPLIYYQDFDGSIYFASELKALLQCPNIPREIEPASVYAYLHLMTVPTPWTIYRGIKKLEPGTLLIADSNGARLQRYWDLPPYPGESKIDLEQAQMEFLGKFKEAITTHLVSDVPVAAFLSGGIDSSSVVAMAAGLQPLATFTATFPESDVDESDAARRVARHCHTDHHEIRLAPDFVETLPHVAWHCDEPFGVASAFGVYHMAEAAREHAKVVLSGDGADELFAGYPWRHQPIHNHRHWDLLPVVARRWVSHLGDVLHDLNGNNGYKFTRRLASRLQFASLGPADTYAKSLRCFQDEDIRTVLHSDCTAFARRAWRENAIARYYDSASGSDVLYHKLYADVKTTLVDEMLTKVDRMTMAHGLEARVPFLDNQMVEWAFQIPSDFKFHNGAGKVIVRQAMRSALPEEILKRGKYGFTLPLAGWFRGPLRNFLQDALNGPAISQSPFFSRPGIQRLVEENEKGERDLGNCLYTLLMYALWYDKVHRGLSR